MTEPWEAAGRWAPAEDWTPPRRPAPAPASAAASARGRRPLLIAAGVAAVWIALYVVTGSLIGATALLLLLAALGVAVVLSLRSLGVDRDHPRVRQMARVWSDGRDRSDGQDRMRSTGPEPDRFSPDRLASGRPSVYGPSPDGAPPDGASLRRPPSDGPSSSSGSPSGGSSSAGSSSDRRVPDWEPREWPSPDWSPREWSPATGCRVSYAEAMGTRVEPMSSAAAAGLMTVAEPVVPVVPVLSLITGGNVTQTRRSGARAGRGDVDLVLPQVATVSREHAKFTYTDGQWWIANLGRNGLTLNGAPLREAGHPLHNGDSIRWGMRPDALVSRVEIGGPPRP